MFVGSWREVAHEDVCKMLLVVRVNRLICAGRGSPHTRPNALGLLRTAEENTSALIISK